MTIRAITEQDFLKWQTMRLKLWSHVTESENREFFAAILADDSRGQIFVAEDEAGELAGFLEAALRFDYVEGAETSPVGYIEGWFVEADARRQKVGTTLAQAAEAWAREKGCAEMCSDCELDNDLSLAAHLGAGYEEAGRNIHFIKQL